MVPLSATELDQKKINSFIHSISEWYKHNRRDHFFWRNTKNPYYILVSEMMLQKTTAKQVQIIIPIFLERFPSPYDLAEADIEEIKRIITPLGMEHRRAIRFKKWAGIIVQKFSGRIPDSELELASLPGVGKYMANSVLCLAYSRDVPLLDTNIVRILKRVFSIKSEKSRPRTDQKHWDFVSRITPQGKSRDVNLALLDFGALVCTAKKPKHSVCPVSGLCDAFKKDLI